MIYSGNLNDYHTAHAKLKSLGFRVEEARWHSLATRHHGFGFTVWISKTEGIWSPPFEHYDEDVVTIQATEWLNKTYHELSHWK